MRSNICLFCSSGVPTASRVARLISAVQPKAESVNVYFRVDVAAAVSYGLGRTKRLGLGLGSVQPSRHSGQIASHAS